MKSFAKVSDAIFSINLSKQMIQLHQYNTIQAQTDTHAALKIDASFL